MTAQKQQSKELTAEELDRIALKICVECGIKDSGIPSEEMVDMCLKSWQEHFSGQMNKAEIALAFDMNVNGEFSKKIEHFQCFSREYFCDVLNAYLTRKKQVLSSMPKEEDSEKVKVDFDLAKVAMECLIFDRENISEGKLSESIPVKEKLEWLNSLFELDITEDQVKNYRKISTSLILTKTATERNEARVNRKFGVEIEMANKVERLKSGTLSDKDEAEIQHEVNKLIYGNALLIYSEFDFVNHIKGQINANA